MKSLLKYYMLALAVAIISICANAEPTQTVCERGVVHNNTYCGIFSKGDHPVLNHENLDLNISKTPKLNESIKSPIPLEWEGKAKWYIDGRHSFNSEEKIIIEPFSENQKSIQGVWQFKIFNLDGSLYGNGTAAFKGQYSFTLVREIRITEISWIQDPTRNGDVPFVLYPVEGTVNYLCEEIEWDDSFKFYATYLTYYTDFTFGKDSNIFINNKSDFGATKSTSTSLLFTLCKRVGFVHLPAIIWEMEKPWGGSCYGISATMGLVYEKFLTVYDISDEPKIYYSKMTFPINNEELRNVINYYQLTWSYIHHDYWNPNGNLRSFIDAIISSLRNNKVVLLYLSFSSGGAHEVLITGYSYNRNKKEYYFYICDPNKSNVNFFQARVMTINSDSFDFNISRGTYTNRNITKLGLNIVSDLKNVLHKSSKANEQLLDALPNDELTYIVFPNDSHFVLTTSTGLCLVNDENGFSGTLPIEDYNYIQVDNKSGIRIESKLFDKCVIDSKSKNIDLEIYNVNGFKAISGKQIQEIDLSISGDMKLTGDAFSFKAFSSVDQMLNEYETGLGSIYAKGKGEVVIRKGQDTIEAVSENPMSHIETKIYQGVEVIEGKIKGKQNSVVIKPCEETIGTSTSIEDGMIIFSKQGYAYRGRPIKPFVSVYVGGKSLKKNKEFKVQYENNVEIGTGKLTVVGVGEYNGTVSAEFPIIPKKVKMKKVSSCKSGFEVTWNSSGPKDGFEIQYDTDPDFRKAKTKKIEDGEASSAQVDGLEIGEEYFVRMRAYKSEAETGKTYNSNWSDVKSVLIYPY